MRFRYAWRFAPRYTTGNRGFAPRYTGGRPRFAPRYSTGERGQHGVRDF